MTEDITFGTFITKGMDIEKSELDQRIFTGHITSEIVDLQKEIIARDEVYNIMKIFMEINPVISDSHSNRMVGKVLSYEKSEIEGHPSVKIKGQIYKHKDVTLYDKVWEAIVTKEYKGMSMGGASKTRTPMVTKDGTFVMKLSDLELYEIAVCKTPANQLAIIDNVNAFAKDNNMLEKIQELSDGRHIIKCSSIICSVTAPITKIEAMAIEPHGLNQDLDLDNNNEKPKGALEELGVEKQLKDIIVKLIKDEVKKTSAHEYLPMEKCGYCGMNKEHESHFVMNKDQTKKYLMTEEEHNGEYGQKEKAEQKENDLTGIAENKDDNLVKDVNADMIEFLCREVMKNDIRKLLK